LRFGTKRAYENFVHLKGEKMKILLVLPAGVVENTGQNFDDTAVFDLKCRFTR
jgi:hypothetical protein